MINLDPTQLVMCDRNGVVPTFPSYEKSIILPAVGQTDPTVIGWTDARFAIDIMMEHALFFILLMPPEVAGIERLEAEGFHSQFAGLLAQIDGVGVPSASDLPMFATNLVESIKPFIDYKHRMEALQTSGSLRSLVWPLFFDHTRREAERWCERLIQISKGEAAFDKREVATFWSEIMDDH